VKSAGAATGEQAGTRGQVARLILELGPCTAATLGGRLGLTPAAIRRHLDNLIADGMIEQRTARTYGNRGRGRPAKVFVITDAGRSAFEHAYDDLATSALRFIERTYGAHAVAEFARQQVSELERRYATVLTQADLTARVQALADVLSADGYAAAAGPAPAVGAVGTGLVGNTGFSGNTGSSGNNGFSGNTGFSDNGAQICQHHCPVAHVAAEFPQLCEAETEAFGRLLGTPVRRLATIAHGDGICTTHVTSAGAQQGPARTRTARMNTARVTTRSESGGL
jgi:predicted ArsR family transcriptional regulator